jgi:hypothetical protein
MKSRASDAGHADGLCKRFHVAFSIGKGFNAFITRNPTPDEEILESKEILTICLIIIYNKLSNSKSE